MVLLLPGSLQYGLAFGVELLIGKCCSVDRSLGPYSRGSGQTGPIAVFSIVWMIAVYCCVSNRDYRSFALFDPRAVHEIVRYRELHSQGAVNRSHTFGLNTTRTWRLTVILFLLRSLRGWLSLAGARSRSA